jgi:hypothetical protein
MPFSPFKRWQLQLGKYSFLLPQMVPCENEDKEGENSMNCLKRWIVFNMVIPWEDYWMHRDVRKVIKKCRKMLEKAKPA